VRTQSPPAYPPEFLRAVQIVLAHEGGESDISGDRGGLTRFGISSREYHDIDVANLTRDDAIAIYYRDFWTAARLGSIPAPLGAKCFDLAVNIGSPNAVKCLQRALRAVGESVGEDGVIGAATVSASRRANTNAALAAMRSEAAGYYRTIAALARGPRAEADREFLAGWLNRAYA